MSNPQAAYTVATSAAAASALLRSMAELVVDDDTAEIIIDTETDLPAAIEAALDRIAELEQHREAITARMADLAARKARFGENIEALRRSIQSALETVQLRKLELPVATISLRAVPPSVVITDEAALPVQYMRQPPPVPDKKLIATDLKNGFMIDGAELSNGGQTISIKRT